MISIKKNTHNEVNLFGFFVTSKQYTGEKIRAVGLNKFVDGNSHYQNPLCKSRGKPWLVTVIRGSPISLFVLAIFFI